MTGAVAAMAEPPQIDDPTPISVLMRPSMRSSLCSRKAISSEVEMVHRMMGRDCLPVSSTTLRLSPNPSSTTAACSTFLETKVTPGLNASFGDQNSAMTMPMRIENTAPPTTGTSLPSSQAGIEMARHTPRPGSSCLIFCTKKDSFLSEMLRKAGAFCRKTFLII